MKKSYAIQFKAAFLLIIFSLNMVVGFACSVGFDTGFNPSHHVEIEIQIPHKHTHQHRTNTVKDHHADHKSHEHKTTHKEKEEKKGCCNDEVQKVQQLDKNINSIEKSTAPSHRVLLLPSFFQTYIVKLLKANPSKGRERFFYPPPPNILVESQRFQI